MKSGKFSDALGEIDISYVEEVFNWLINDFGVYDKKYYMSLVQPYSYVFSK